MVQFRNSSLYNHRGNWSVDEAKLKETIRTRVEKVNHKHRTLDIYLMDKSDTSYGTDTGTIRIFVGATPGKYSLVADTIKMADNEYAIEMYALNDTSNSEVYLDNNGKIVAYQEEGKQAYYIPFALTGMYEEIAVDIIMHAVDVIVEKGIGEIVNENNWVKTKNKQAIVKQITDNFSGSYLDKKRRIDDRIISSENYINEYRNSLKQHYDALTQARKELLSLEHINNEKEIQNFIRGLDQIAEQPRVSNIDIEGELITISVDEVYAYAENRDGDEGRYYIGNMRIQININNTDVRFFGDNPRRGYWGVDPHPHVDGSNGRACLGNVAASIAELCSQKEIYGLFLIAMDFLENANVDDPAGRKIYMWDEVDEDGNIIREGGDEPDWHCENCGAGQYDGDDSYFVYTEYDGEGGATNGEDWCESCRDEDVTWNDEVEEYVTYSVDEQIEEYHSEDEEEEGEDW